MHSKSFVHTILWGFFYSSKCCSILQWIRHSYYRRDCTASCRWATKRLSETGALLLGPSGGDATARNRSSQVVEAICSTSYLVSGSLSYFIYNNTLHSPPKRIVRAGQVSFSNNHSSFGVIRALQAVKNDLSVVKPLPPPVKVVAFH